MLRIPTFEAFQNLFWFSEETKLEGERWRRNVKKRSQRVYKGEKMRPLRSHRARVDFSIEREREDFRAATVLCLMDTLGNLLAKF